MKFYKINMKELFLLVYLCHLPYFMLHMYLHMYTWDIHIKHFFAHDDSC